MSNKLPSLVQLSVEMGQHCMPNTVHLEFAPRKYNCLAFFKHVLSLLAGYAAASVSSA